MLRFAACDRGRLGGGVNEPEEPGGGESTARGVRGTPFVAPSPSAGAKFDREREAMRFGGDAVRSMAEAARAGGGAKKDPFGILGAEWLGEAV
jgi:hypothetical protein